MAYQRNVWVDHVVERPKTYKITDNADGSKTLSDSMGEVIQQGTPMSATNFNRPEEALQHYSIAFDMLLSMMQATIRSLEERLGQAEEKLSALTSAASE